MTLKRFDDRVHRRVHQRKREREMQGGTRLIIVWMRAREDSHRTAIRLCSSEQNRDALDAASKKCIGLGLYHGYQSEVIYFKHKNPSLCLLPV